MNPSPRDWPHGAESTGLTSSFDGGAVVRCAMQRPDRYAFFNGGGIGTGGIGRYAIARGAGLSYAAASFGGGAVSIDLSAFDRVLDFDSASGVIEVEAGMRMVGLLEFLTQRGFYLPVVPGHGGLSVGGCIAADVHGKNQARDGTFIRQVEALRLFHPAHGCVDLSPASDAGLFRATCGGYGTTGLIVSAQLRAERLPAQAVELSWHAAESLSDGIAQLRGLAASSDFAYSWHDLARRDSGFGRGYVCVGRFVSQKQTGPPRTVRWSAPGLSASRRRLLPVNLLHAPSVALVNAIYALKRRNGSEPAQAGLADCLFPIHGSEMYFHLFGKAGFHECQAVIPHAQFDAYSSGLRSAISKHGVVVTLASAKLFAGQSDLLRFTGDGICLAINIARDARSKEFLAELDRLIVAVGGRPNIIKDSRLPKAVVEAAYPGVDNLRSTLRRWDAQRVFRSELSTRLEL